MAGRRNATPDVLDLPADVVPSLGTQTAWHDVRFVEPDFLKSEELRVTDLTGIRVDGLDLVSQLDGGLRIDVFGKRQFTLRPGEIGVVVYNWVDDVIEDAWRTSVYHKVSAHIANGISWDATIFRGAPNHVSRCMRDLA